MARQYQALSVIITKLFCPPHSSSASRKGSSVTCTREWCTYDASMWSYGSDLFHELYRTFGGFITAPMTRSARGSPSLCTKVALSLVASLSSTSGTMNPSLSITMQLLRRHDHTSQLDFCGLRLRSLVLELVLLLSYTDRGLVELVCAS